MTDIIFDCLIVIALVLIGVMVNNLYKTVVFIVTELADILLNQPNQIKKHKVFYRHKKTGKPYSIVIHRFMFKENGEWKKDLVLYQTEYENPDGKYFARTKEDFDANFEKEEL